MRRRVLVLSIDFFFLISFRLYDRIFFSLFCRHVASARRRDKGRRASKCPPSLSPRTAPRDLFFYFLFFSPLTSEPRRSRVITDPELASVDDGCDDGARGVHRDPEPVGRRREATRGLGEGHSAVARQPNLASLSTLRDGDDLGEIGRGSDRAPESRSRRASALRDKRRARVAAKVQISGTRRLLGGDHVNAVGARRDTLPLGARRRSTTLARPRGSGVDSVVCKESGARRERGASFFFFFPF